MPNRLVDGLRRRYPDIAGNPETATSATDGPDPENAQGSPVYPAWGASTDTAPENYSSTRQIPYRGAEPHGVMFTPETHPDPRSFETPSVAGQNPVPLPEPSGLEDIDPVPVHIVANSADPATRMRFVATTMVLPGTTVNPVPQPVRIAGLRTNRTKIKVWIKQIPSVGAGPSRVWISQDEGAGGPMGNGFPLDGPDASSPATAWESNTTDDIWCCVDQGGTNGALVCIYEEYETEIPPDMRRPG